MKKGLLLSVGMPRAGSGWHYNIIHDLVAASGGENSREIRSRYHLERILTEVNCNIGVLSFRRLIVAAMPVLFGKTYVIKAHSAPKPFAKLLIKIGFLKAIYIYRDPRDALLSAFEYGKRMRDSNRTNAFSHLKTKKEAIDFMTDYVVISEQWLALDQVLHVRYENLLQNYNDEIRRLSSFLGIELGSVQLEEIINKYHPGRGSEEQKGTHFVKGKIGRHKDSLTGEEIEMCKQRFGVYLTSMGYEDRESTTLPE